MKIGRAAVVGAALLASLAFVAGCQGSKSPSSNGANTTTSTSAKAASEELADAMRKLNSTSYSFSVAMDDGQLTGALDPARNAAKISLRAKDEGQSFAVDLVLVDPDMYVRIDGMALPGIAAGKYLQLDATKVKSLGTVGVDNLDDPTQSAELMQSLVSVEKTGTGTFKGTVDLTRMKDLDDEIKALGDKAKAVPFEATVDTEGRLTKMKISVPADGTTPARTIELTYSDFGSVTITKPAESEVVKAPDAIYGMFNS